jgi:YVTN family beta-propeller protein
VLSEDVPSRFDGPPVPTLASVSVPRGDFDTLRLPWPEPVLVRVSRIRFSKQVLYMRKFACGLLLWGSLSACPRSESTASVDAATNTESKRAGDAQPFAERARDASPATAKGPRLYVSNEASGNVTVIDISTSKAVATLAVGKRPRGIQKAPDGSAVYVALSGSVPNGPEKGDKAGKDEKDASAPDKSADGIGIIDPKTLTLIGKLPSGSDPENMAVSVDGSLIYISNEDAAEMSIIELAGKRIQASYKVGEEPEGVGVSPDGKWVYVTCEATNTVHVFDVKAKKMVAKITVPGRPRGVAFLPDSLRAYVTSETGGAISVVSLPEHKVIKTLKPEGENVRPMGVAAAPDGTRIYVTTGHGGTVLAIDTKKNEVVAKTEVGKRPWGVVVTPDGKTVYTANGPSDDVSVVDADTMKEKERIKVGRKPWGLVLLPAPE